MVAEYMASRILKYNLKYDEQLVYQEEPEEEQETSMEPTASLEPESSPAASSAPEAGEDIPAAGGKLSDIFDTYGVDISYTGYKTHEAYGEGQYLVTPSSKGSTLLVISFKLRNKGNKEIKLNFLDESIAFRLDNGQGRAGSPLLTALENDLQNLEITIAPGKSKSAILVFEISKKLSPSDFSLYITKNKTISKIDIE